MMGRSDWPTTHHIFLYVANVTCIKVKKDGSSALCYPGVRVMGDHQTV